MRIAYLTAGAAGMYCGSCMQDNALAKSLHALGHDTLLMPTYTPIQTDESDFSQDQLLYGGLNVYLQQISGIFRYLPKWADRMLAAPGLVRWIASRSLGTSPEKLGPLTVSMLQGAQGRQRKEVNRLCEWLEQIEPDVVIFSNLLIAGALPEIKRRLSRPCAVILQGDDIFYESLPKKYRTQAIAELQRLADHVDIFLTHSREYAGRMSKMLDFPLDRSRQIPLAIDLTDFDANNRATVPNGDGPSASPTIGYLARLAPEKGLHLLVDAFIEVHKQLPEAKLKIAGWLGPQHNKYWSDLQDRLNASELAQSYQYSGSVDRDGKIDFLSSIDFLCVPTTYAEPKGLFVLEAAAMSVPYILPHHGAFSELHESLNGGWLVEPNSSDAIADQIIACCQSAETMSQRGQSAAKNVRCNHSARGAAESLIDILQSL